MKARKAGKAVFIVILAVMLVLTMLLPACLAQAAGVSVTASFDTASGVLTAKLNGTVSGTVSYSWKGGGSNALAGQSVTPTEGGSYVCTATVATKTDTKDSNGKTTSTTSTATYTSNTVNVFKVSSDSFVKLNTINGLYQKGDHVRATATLTGTQRVTGWTASVPGLRLPKSGNTVYFTMPAASLTLTCTAPSIYSVKVSGGTSDKYSAQPGEKVTVKASEINGKVFDAWSASGLDVQNGMGKIFSFTMPESNVILTASFKKPEASGGTETTETVYSTDTFTDPTRLKYTVTRTNHYKVRMYHAKLGKNYDAAFKKACGSDTLVTNYFTLVINDNKDIMESPGPVTVVLTLPEDIQNTGRNFRMVCISRQGRAYSFADEDADDATLTFSANRFGAYAICYNDRDYAAEQAEAEAAAAQAEEQAKTDSYNNGYAQGLKDGQSAGYNEGYSQGQQDASAAQAMTSTDTSTSSAPSVVSTAHSASESQTTGSGSSSGSGSAGMTYEPYSGAESQHITSGSSSSQAPVTFTL